MLMSKAVALFSDWRKLKVKGDTVKCYDRDLRFLCLYLRDPEIEDVTLEQLVGYMSGLTALGWDSNTMIVKAMAIRKFLEFWRLQGYEVINEELVPVPSKKYKLPRVASEDDYQKLLAAIPQRTRDPRHIRNNAIVRLLWDTGGRNGEILSLNLTDLDSSHREAIIATEKSKGRRPFRQVLWSDETNGALVRWLEKREDLRFKMKEFMDEEAVFISICGSRFDTSGRRFTIKGVGEMLRRYANRAGLPILNAHSFRHHKGHDIIQRGGSVADVMNILGHSSVQSTTIYTAMAGREMRDRARMFLAK
jgi:integrase/recombinase XerD